MRNIDQIGAEREDERSRLEQAREKRDIVCRDMDEAGEVALIAQLSPSSRREKIKDRLWLEQAGEDIAWREKDEDGVV